ncbi:DMT family transporter [Rhizobium sp. 18055]|jgi:drug/metabolite transporter (DMT)-like permease|uniref:DMT family transporter n=1 Tax=Rhizobium sp. 18055 TaxID=2681403 RepID=UPI00135AA2D6|nr:DMT family transporter [Rhizobium sp. 18055]
MKLASNRLFGITLVAASAVLWSTAGLFVRMADLDIWSIVGWRSAFSAVTLGLFMLIRNRVERGSASRSFGWPGVGACAVSVIAAISYIAALQWTSVANVMTIYAALPFLATAIAFLWFGERVTMRFIVAGLLAFCGIAVTVGAAVTARDLLGLVAAFAMTAGFASQLVIAKRYPSMDTTLMTACGAAACVVIALPFMQHSIPAPMQLLACALYGILTTGIAYVLVLMGSRLIGSGEAGFISLLDVVLGPFWVWLFYDEQISLPVFAGGGIVLFSVVWYLSGAGFKPTARLPAT